jgi:acyl carrier protein
LNHMTKEEIAGIIKKFLIDEFEIDEAKITPEAHLKDDLGLESLDFVDIAVIVQKEFGLTLKGEEMTAIRTLDDLHGYIYNCISKK